MKRQTVKLVIVLLCAVASSVIAGDFKSVMIMPASESLTLDVPDGQFLTIRNFTQEGNSQRGVVTVTADGQTNNVLVAVSRRPGAICSTGVYEEGSDFRASSNNSGACVRSDAFRNLQKRTPTGKPNACAHTRSHGDTHADAYANAYPLIRETFTFKEFLAVKETRKRWNHLLAILLRSWPDLQGLRVFKVHERHGLHVHLITNQFIDENQARELAERAAWGRIHVTRMPSEHAGYLAKSLSKERPECLHRWRLWAGLGKGWGVDESKGRDSRDPF